MQTIRELERHGYRFWLEGGTIQFECNGKPDPATVMPLLAALQANKAEAISYLQLVEYLRRQFVAHGIASFHSGRLSEAVYILQDYDSLAALPAGCLAFTLVELRNMAAQAYTDVELLEVAQAKRDILAAHKVWLGKRGDGGLAAVLQVFPDATVLPAQRTTAELVEKCRQAMANTTA
ncbi:MAG: hypothetical protein DDT29_02174 [Dehalococcoidia bacterium]|nr:hypothetical protein [Bacillota bacterium]